MGKIFCWFMAVLFACHAFGADLVGTASVSITSDTAAVAKKMAFDEARRQILVDALGAYADVSALKVAVANEQSSVLTNLIASSSISGERQSNTTYSANISMTINCKTAKNWMQENGIQNWLAVTEENANKFLLIVDLKDKISDWATLRRMALDAKIDLDTLVINDNQVVFAVPGSRRGVLTVRARENGWRYRNVNENLYLFK